jgi:excisionase family DNA binding protein
VYKEQIMAKRQERYYTVTEAAKRLHVTRMALHKAITDGRLQATWTTIEQVITKRALVISAKNLKNFKVDKAQQIRGKKTPQSG